MSDTTQIVEQAIAKQEAEEAGIVTDDDKNPKGGANDDTSKTPAKDDSDSKSKSGEDTDEKSKSDADDKPKYDKDGKRIEPDAEDDKKPELDKDGKPIEKKEEGKFTADDVDEKEDKPGPAKVDAPTDAAGIQLSPAEQKYIADNIGEAIIIRGFRGEGENAKEVELKVYHPGEIPADFKFSNDQQLLAAQNGFQALENKATQLLGTFRQNQSTAAARDFEQRENEGIRADVADLQKEGRFPKFTIKPSDAGFDDTSEAKQMAEVLTVMTQRNEEYLKQYNQGRPYRHIGFAEAFDIWERKNPERQAAKKVDDDQKSEDEERRARADRGPSNRGMSSTNIVKPTVRPGTTTRDILARIDADDSF